MSNLPKERASKPASDAPSGPPSTGHAVIPPRRSEQRLSATKGSSELELRLHQVMQNLQWLEERMSVPSTVAPLDDVQERGRAMWMVSETRGLVEESLRELEGATQPAVIPAAPKVPKL